MCANSGGIGGIWDHRPNTDGGSSRRGGGAGRRAFEEDLALFEKQAREEMGRDAAGGDPEDRAPGTVPSQNKEEEE